MKTSFLTLLLALACCSAFAQNTKYTGRFFGNGAGLTNIPGSGLTTPLTLPGIVIVTNVVIGNGSGLTNIHLAGIEISTNAWTPNTSPNLQTAYTLVSGAATFGIPGIGNIGATSYRHTELKILCTGNVTFTNPVAWYKNDQVNSRTLTNGNLVQISIEVQAGVYTNMMIVQSTP